MNLEKLVRNFCDFIEHFEKYENDNSSEAKKTEHEFLKDKTEEEKVTFKHLKDCFELQYAPWRKFPKDKLYESILKEFTDNPKEVLHYGRVTDMVSDDFIFPAVEQLEKYYKAKGINKEDIELFDEVSNYKSKEDLNEKIFSIDIINLFDLYMEAERLQKDISDYYNVKIRENELEEIDK